MPVGHPVLDTNDKTSKERERERESKIRIVKRDRGLQPAPIALGTFHSLGATVEDYSKVLGQHFGRIWLQTVFWLVFSSKPEM